MGFVGRELRSTIGRDGILTLSLEESTTPDPGDDEVVVRIQAAPINPSDLVLMLGPADVTTLQAVTGDAAPRLRFKVPPDRLHARAGRPDQTAAGRIDRPVPVGIEGAGVVVAAGRKVQALEGRLVSFAGGGTYADYRLFRAQDVTPLPPGATATQGAAMVVNPLTVLGFVETARAGGHTAIVHTAAASSVGQMLQRVCLADGIPLVNVVRSQAQVDLLRERGATFALNSRDLDFGERLVSALKATGATIAFDPIGGGTVGSDLLEAIEAANGSETPKQLFVYGFLEDGPTILNWAFLGDEWSVSGWRLPPFLKRVGHEVEQRLRARVALELTTTFANIYTRVIGLAEALQPEVLGAYHRKATGEKFLIDPTRG